MEHNSLEENLNSPLPTSYDVANTTTTTIKNKQNSRNKGLYVPTKEVGVNRDQQVEGY